MRRRRCGEYSIRSCCIGVPSVPRRYDARCLFGGTDEYSNVRFDIYGRFELEARREGQGRVMYRLGYGLRRRDDEMVLPASMPAPQIAICLDDLCHELAGPGQVIRRLR